MGTIRHYGHRREIETLSSPLGRHFGETGLDLFKALLTSLLKSTRMLPQGKVAVMTTGNFKSSTRWTKASLDSWGRGEQTFEDKSLLQKKTTFITPPTLQGGVLAEGTVHSWKPRTKFKRGTNLI